MRFCKCTLKCSDVVSMYVYVPSGCFTLKSFRMGLSNVLSTIHTIKHHPLSYSTLIHQHSKWSYHIHQHTFHIGVFTVQFHTKKRTFCNIPYGRYNHVNNSRRHFLHILPRASKVRNLLARRTKRITANRKTRLVYISIYCGAML